MHNRTIRLALSIALLAALAAPAGLSAQSGWPRTVTDDTGAAVRIKQKPERIASLTLPTDEILLSLVAKPRLAAVTLYAEDPAVSNVTGQVFDIPVKMSQINAEAVVALKPDLVFVANWSQASVVKQLRDAGLPVYQFQSPFTVKEIQARIAAVGRAVGEEAAAAALSAWMDGRLSALSARLSALPADKRLTVMDWSTWGTSMGAASSWNEIVRRAGLRNAVADMKADQYGTVTISREAILTIDPDMIVLPGWVYGDPKGSDTFYNAFVTDPAFRGLKAVKQGRVHRMAEALKSATSQYIVFAMEDLAKYAYPELFK
jgi:iron complex transport system substrate-binding protein